MWMSNLVQFDEWMGATYRISKLPPDYPDAIQYHIAKKYGACRLE